MTDINARDEEGQTQLHRAADAGDCDEVTRLLTDKADPELKENTDGFVRPRSFALRRVVWRKYDSVKYHLFSVKLPVLQMDAAPCCLVAGKRERCARVDRCSREP